MLGSNLVDQMSSWIKTKHENLWLSHKKIFIESFNLRIVSIDETMHSNMKASDKRCLTNRSIHVATEQMIAKVEKKGGNIT